MTLGCDVGAYSSHHESNTTLETTMTQWAEVRWQLNVANVLRNKTSVCHQTDMHRKQQFRQNAGY
jgi:hypothetical protein